MKMKVYSEPYNFLSIKVALAAEISDVPIEFLIPPSKGLLNQQAPRHFPLLEINSEQFLFSPNSIIRYLLTTNENKNNLTSQDWLDWECSRLFPAVVNASQLSFAGASKIPDDLKKSLKSSLCYLNDYLAKNTTFSPEGKLGAAEIAIWSTLFLIFKHEKLHQEFLTEFEALKTWWENISALEPTQKAVNRILNGKDITALKNIILNVSIPQPKEPTMIKSPTVTAVLDEELSVVTEDEITSALECFYRPLKTEDLRKTQSFPVLPKKNERNCLITSALPYVNNVPHLGNIIGAVLSADVFARYCRLQQYNVLYICGTDEYGTATETKALEEQTTPQKICDKYNKLHKDIYDWFNIQFDFFGRTSTEHQTEICQEIFWKLYSNKFILKDTTEQLYCNKCSRFLADRFVEGICPFCSYNDARGDQCDKCQKLINPVELVQPRCKICQTSPQLKSSEHLYLDLPKLQPMVKDFVDQTADNWTQTARVISQAWLKEGLKPRCITRDLKWGTPVPLEGFTDKVFYVWFDAPIGYLSITKGYTKEWEKWWKNPDDVELYQFMAKDNVAFHGIIFPSTCIGTKENYTKVKYLAAVEYLNYEDTKFSKSRGIGVFGNEAQDTEISPDIYRFYLLYIRPENQDTAFSWVDFMTKNNSELLNNLGNYINRASTFIYNNFGGQIPKIVLNREDGLLLGKINHEIKDYIALMEKIKLRDGLRVLLNISRLGNQHIQGNKPWELIKGNEEERLRSGSVMGLSVNVACLLSLLMEPYMPETSKEIKRQLNFPMEKNILTPDLITYLPEGHPINKPIPLFKKIEEAQAESLKRLYGGKQSPQREMPSPTKEKQTEVSVAADASEIEAMSLLIQQQGEKVRDLKKAKVEKVLIDAEVVVLLNLKKKLSQLKGEDSAAPIKNEKKKKK